MPPVCQLQLCKQIVNPCAIFAGHALHDTCPRMMTSQDISGSSFRLSNTVKKCQIALTLECKLYKNIHQLNKDSAPNGAEMTGLTRRCYWNDISMRLEHIERRFTVIPQFNCKHGKQWKTCSLRMNSRSSVSLRRCLLQKPRSSMRHAIAVALLGMICAVIVAEYTPGSTQFKN